MGINFSQLIPIVRYISKVNGGNSWGFLSHPFYMPVKWPCHLFLGPPLLLLPPRGGGGGGGGWFIICLISGPVKSLPLRHGQSALMSASFLCNERVTFMK